MTFAQMQAYGDALIEVHAASSQLDRSMKRLAEAQARFATETKKLLQPRCGGCGTPTRPGMFVDKCVRCAWGSP